MRKVSLLTRKFINDNIKVNTTASSYPLRTISPRIAKPSISEPTIGIVHRTADISQNNKI